MALDIGPITGVVLLVLLVFVVLGLGVIALQWVFRRYL